jgi:hypothetical protein
MNCGAQAADGMTSDLLLLRGWRYPSFMPRDESVTDAKMLPHLIIPGIQESFRILPIVAVFGLRIYDRA